MHVCFICTQRYELYDVNASILGATFHTAASS